ncbi:unnamed protein product [Calypogeia fissa]
MGSYSVQACSDLRIGGPLKCYRNFGNDDGSCSSSSSSSLDRLRGNLDSRLCRSNKSRPVSPAPVPHDSLRTRAMRTDRQQYSEEPSLRSGIELLESTLLEKLSSGVADREAPTEEGKQRGWRALSASEDGITQLGRPKPFPLRRPWRKSNARKQRFRSADNNHLGGLSSSSQTLAPVTRDASLEDLFKSLASPQTTDRSSAIERYFGRELNYNDRPTTAGEGFFSETLGAGTTEVTELSSGPVREGRLKINLDLDLYRARCLREEGRLDEAEAILNECIRDWQDDGRAYLALGLLALPLKNDQVNKVDGNNVLSETDVTVSDKKGLFPGDYLTYEDDGRETVPRSPAVAQVGERLKINLDLQLYNAKCMKQKGILDVSETILRKCIRDWPDDGRPYVALGKLFLQQNRIGDARNVYDSGCQAVRGENPYVWQAWATLEEKCGDISKARKLYDAAIVADKKHVSAWHGWANLELRAGNVRKARSLLNKGLKFCGPNEYIYQTLALLESRDGKVEEARSLLFKATKCNPKSTPSWLAWALLEAENNFTDSARRLFQKGVEASPKNRYVWQAWARFEATQGREDRARELFQRGRELNPKDAVLLQAFALFEYACGRPGIARDFFRRALTCDSRHQPIYIAWGWMEWKEGNLSVARELYQGAIQVDSSSMDAARAFQAWGVLEDREGDTGLARELFKCALKIDSQNIPTWMSWAAMEEREGRSVRADEIRNQFLQQRTEVVEGPWDVDLSDLLAPAIDRIKGFFKGRRKRTSSSTSPGPKSSSDKTDTSQSGSNEGVETLEVDGKIPSLDSSPDDGEFDVDRFLKEKFPWRYGFLDERKSFSFAQKSTRNDRL